MIKRFYFYNAKKDSEEVREVSGVISYRSFFRDPIAVMNLVRLVYDETIIFNQLHEIK